MEIVVNGKTLTDWIYVFRRWLIDKIAGDTMSICIAIKSSPEAAIELIYRHGVVRDVHVTNHPGVGIKVNSR